MREGDKVEKGQTVAIIEAMKLMNEIEVPPNMLLCSPATAVKVNFSGVHGDRSCLDCAVDVLVLCKFRAQPPDCIFLPESAVACLFACEDDAQICQFYGFAQPAACADSLNTEGGKQLPGGYRLRLGCCLLVDVTLTSFCRRRRGYHSSDPHMRMQSAAGVVQKECVGELLWHRRRYPALL